MALSAYAATDFGSSTDVAGQDFKRGQYILFANVADFGSTYDSAPTWEAVGHGVETSALNFNIDVTKTPDIFDAVDISANKMEPEQSFDAYKIKKGNKLHFRLFDILERQALPELSLFSLLKVYVFLQETDGAATVYHAELQKNCAVIPQSLANGNKIDMPVNVMFSNVATLGTVASYTSPTFTAFSTEE